MPTVTTLSGQVLSIDLGTRDFEGFRDDALELADTVAPDWTDRSEADVGVTLVESFAFMAGNLSYYQDRVGNEALFPSAVQRRSIIEHSKLIGYELRPNISASVELTVVANAAGTIPAGTQIEVDTTDGSDPQTFEFESDEIFLGSETRVGVIALHGTSVDETLGSSDGSTGQEFVLQQQPLTLNPSGTSSLTVFVADGGPPIAWTEVDNFLESDPTDEVFRIEIDEDDIVTVIFGDGVNGKVPASGTNNVTATYRIGGGRDGNRVGTNVLTRLVGNFPFIDSVTNPEQPSGGADKETIEEAKENAPASIVALNRAVSHPDYVTQAKRVPGVRTALALNGAGAFEERVIVAAYGPDPVPTGTWDPFTATGTGLLGAVGDFIEIRKTTPVVLLIEPASVFEWYLDIEVHLFSNVRRADATRFIEDAVFAAFDIEVQLFGVQLALSRLDDVVEDTAGVDYVNIKRFQRQPYARQLTSASPFDGTFDPITVGLDTPRDRFTVTFLSATTFSVESIEGGVDPSTGTIGVPFTIDGGGLTFTVNAGGTPPNPNDKWEIVTGPYIGNLDPDFDEMGKLAGGSFELSLVGGLG